jgi:hypothetical protein
MFVVDNSGSMEEEQANLGDSFPEFANLLGAYTTTDGTPIDFRIALTTTARTSDFTIVIPGFGSMPQHHTGDDGRFRDGCGSSARWLDNSAPSLASTLSCRANVGTNGPSVEMPLLMAKYALVDRVTDGTQPGFLRDDALLALVMLTDEDDQSTTLDHFTIGPGDDVPLDWNPADEIQFLDSLKGNRSRWAAGVIAGDGDCSSTFGMAADATRLKQFVNMAGSQGVFTSICGGNLATNLQQVLSKIQSACGEIIL